MQRNTINITSDLSLETTEARRQISFKKEGKIKTFADKLKLTEFSPVDLHYKK